MVDIYFYSVINNFASLFDVLKFRKLKTIYENIE